MATRKFKMTHMPPCVVAHIICACVCVCVYVYIYIHTCPSGSDGKESACNAGGLGSIPGLGGSPGERNSYPLQCSCLGNPIDRRAWWDTYSTWGHKELDTTEWLTISLSLSHTHIYKESTCRIEDAGSIPGSGRYPGEGNGNSFQYFCP